MIITKYAEAFNYTRYPIAGPFPRLCAASPLRSTMQTKTEKTAVSFMTDTIQLFGLIVIEPPPPFMIANDSSLHNKRQLFCWPAFRSVHDDGCRVSKEMKNNKARSKQFYNSFDEDSRKGFLFFFLSLSLYPCSPN